jgi:adenylosuccinate synthase
MIVLGLGFGDEGKGLTTSYLCSLVENPLVVRFNGGHQAGHTVVHNGNRHVFSSFGSGTLQDVPTYWSKNCTVYPTAVLNEFKVLNNILPTLDRKLMLYINPLCPVTTPYDVAYNQEVQNKNGTVGVGFGATLERHENHYKLFMQDLFYEKVLIAKLKNIQEHYYYDKAFKKIEIESFLEDCGNMANNWIKIVDDSIMSEYYCIFEGAQGILLDQDFGFFPNVTRSNTTSKNAIHLSKITGRPPQIFYVTRSYQTRHGKGFMTNEGDKLHLSHNKNETNKNHEFQGEFRTSPLDLDLLNYALKCDSHFSEGLVKNLVITCTDQYPIDVNALLLSLDVKFETVYISKGDSIDKMEQVKHVWQSY